jgi:hypothetical protein
VSVAVFIVLLITSIDLPKSQDGTTALMCAAARGRACCVQLLIEAGASAYSQTNVRSDEFKHDVHQFVPRTDFNSIDFSKFDSTWNAKFDL